MRVNGAAVGLGWVLVFVGACDVGTADVGIGGEGNSGPGNGGSMGAFMVGSGGGGNEGPACTDPDCIGNTPQGMCDGSIAVDANDPMDGARAMGLCQKAENGTWGVVDAAWVRSDGQPLTGALLVGKGALSGFGPNVTPREGGKILALSSGTARQPGDAGYESVGGAWKDCTDPTCLFDTPHGTPAGWPKESPACPGVTTGDPYNSAGLKLTIKTPKDAKSFHYDEKFYSYEFPVYVCDEFNDFFVAIMSPPPAGAIDGNISFDMMGNTLSVNAGFLDVCNPGQHPSYPCPSGYSEVVGTGYDEQDPGSAGTSWLQTVAPLDAPGSDITLLFAIWDSGDGVLDSTVLIDNFVFDRKDGQTGTTPIPK